VLANPAERRLDARVVLGDAGIEEALEAGVGHAADGAKSAFGRFVFLIIGVERVVDEAALVVLGGFLGKGLIILFAREILAAADELQRTLDGRVVLRYAGGEQAIDEILRVRQVRPRLAVIADAAVFGIGLVLS